MTFRLCLLGNSHISAYKRALSEWEGQRRDIEISMFGAAGAKFADLTVRQDAIVAKSDAAASSLLMTGGRDRIPFEDYDALVVIGGGTRISEFGSILKQYRPPFANSALRPDKGDESSPRLDTFYHKKRPEPVSALLFDEMMTAAAGSSNAASLLARVARRGGLRLGHVAAPFPSSAVLDAKPRLVVSRIARLGLGRDFADCIWRALQASLPDNTTLIRPPDDVLLHSVLTDKIYSDGSTPLMDERGEHGDDDCIHMNAAYGEIMLQRVIEAICK